MAESSQGTTVPAQATPDPAIPTGEQQVPETQAEEKGVGQETEQTPQPQQESELPANVAAHNREYIQKLEAERDQLRSELGKRKENNDMFKILQPKPLPQPEPVIDPYTGQVDERLTALRNEAWEAKQQAAQANQAIVNFQAEQERREAIREVGPELDSNSPKFNQELHDLTTALILHSMTKQDGVQLSYKEAGLKAKNLLASKNVEKVKAEAAQAAIEQLSPKEQAALEATGNPGRRGTDENLDELRQRTRRGDLDAIISRMKNIPAVGKG